MERYIFLDIDGVLNSDLTEEYTPDGYVGISDENVAVLKQILDATGAKIILTSTWRIEWDPDERKCGVDALYLIEKLKKFGIEIYDKIWREDMMAYRGFEIKTYVEEHGIESWIVIDDDMFFDFETNNIVPEHEVPDYYWMKPKRHGKVPSPPRLLFLYWKECNGLEPRHVEEVKNLFKMQEI